MERVFWEILRNNGGRVGQVFSRGNNLLVGGVGACVKVISASKAKAHF